MNFSKHAKILSLFLLFFSVGLILSHRSLSYSWYWDDLHLIRVFSTSELTSTFTGNYDVDGFETAGYRPLMTLFDHMRALILGENTALHRVFEVALFATFLTLFSQIAAQLGVPYQIAALGGVLTLSSRYSWFNLVWITDAVHTFTGIWVLLATLTLLAHLDQPEHWKLGLFVAFAAMALLTREDAIAMLPMIISLGLFHTFQFWTWDKFSLRNIRLVWKREKVEQTRVAISSLGIAALLLLFVGLLYFLLRHLIIPQAPFRATLITWYYLVWLTLYPMGQPSPLLGDEWLREAWKVVAAFLAFATLFVASPSARRQSFLWLTGVVVTAAPGMTATRTNLLLFPILFYSTWLATIFIELSRKSGWASLGIAVLVAALVLVSSDRNMIAQEVMHPKSLEYIGNAYSIVTQPNAKIPGERLATIKADWAELGIRTLDDFQPIYTRAVDQAKNEGWRRPNRENNFFVPTFGMFQP